MKGTAKVVVAVLAIAALVTMTVVTSTGAQQDDNIEVAVNATVSNDAKVEIDGLENTTMPRRIWDDAMTALEAAYEGTDAKGGIGTVATSSGDSMAGEIYVSMPDGSTALIEYDLSDETSPCHASHVDGVPKTAKGAGGNNDDIAEEKSSSERETSKSASASKEKSTTRKSVEKERASKSDSKNKESSKTKQVETAAEKAAKLTGWVAVTSCNALSDDAKRMIDAACKLQGGSGEVLVASVSKSNGKYALTARRGNMYMSVSYTEGSDKVKIAVL